jgi:hypothetical protein
VARILRISGFSLFGGRERDLDPFWGKFVPVYPRSGNLYDRLDMPSILHNETHSVALYAGGGDSLGQRLAATLANHPEYIKETHAIGIIADADNNTPDSVSARYHSALQSVLPGFPRLPGVVVAGSQRLGVYVLPDNAATGVLDHMLIECGRVVYPDMLAAAQTYVDGADAEHKHGWKPFDEQKATVAAVASILKPGKTNTVTISDNDWISERTLANVPSLRELHGFLRGLLDIH